ncbi:MAG: sigma-54 factor interaction domain-containing protein [Phycisphaerae bacterium]
MEIGGKEFPVSRDGGSSGFGGGVSPIIGDSPTLRRVVATADEVAGNDCTVLIEGESGTGKELLARRIHRHSSRRDGPFVPVSCPGVTDSLFESQFYGHVRGAFTGATTDSMGVVRSAENGTLMLDEIGELSLHLQPKLLRLLQEREVVPVGASQPIKTNTRFIAATNRNLTQQVARGEFRTDLYHRLNVVRLEMPPCGTGPPI